MDLTTLHRETARHDFYLKQAGNTPRFDEGLNAWVIAAPSQCREAIASRNLRPVTYAEDYGVLRSRLRLDFSSLSFAFDYIPLCNHGERHEFLRRQMSELLVDKTAAFRSSLARAIQTHFSVLRNEGEFELMREAIVPLVNDIFSAVVGLDNLSCCRDASIIFDRFIGVRKRLRLEAEIAQLRQLISSTLGSQATEEEIGLRLALLILGRDALIGTLGESLHRLLVDNPQGYLCDLSYPTVPPETGVPFIERLVVEPFQLAGCSFAVGERVRILLQSLAYVSDAKLRTGFFGGGLHSCLGRRMSIEIWTAITAMLASIPLRAQIRSYVSRRSDYVFTCPESLIVVLKQ